MRKKQVCLTWWENMINHKEKEMAKIDPGLNIDTDILNVKRLSVWWCLHVSSNTKVTIEAKFLKSLNNTEAALKKSAACKKYVKSI